MWSPGASLDAASAMLVADIRADARAIDDPLDVLARIALATISEPGDRVIGLLVERFGPLGTAARVFDALDDRADQDRRVTSFVEGCLGAGVLPGGGAGAADVRALRDALDRWRPRAERVDVRRTMQQASAVGACLIVPGDEMWPSGVDDLGEHRPLLLWMRSETRTNLFAGPAVAMVGCRSNTSYGAEIAAEFTAAAAGAGAGATIVSGGAYGIDAIAHRVAIGVGGRTVAFLAGGIDQFYPAGNTELLRNVARTGAVVSETVPGTRPTRWRFLNRNRLIAACSGATVVVEAAQRSGAINTANHAAHLGRAVFAVPGPVTSAASAGCHRLIAEGTAQLLGSRAELLAALGPAALGSGARGSAALGSAALGSAAFGGTDPTVVRVLDTLGRSRGIPTEEAARRAGLSILDAADALALAELQGLATPGPSGWRIV